MVLSQALCYALSDTGTQLLPLAGFPRDDSKFPAQDMDELDNPLVYGLVGGEPCMVERIGQLVGLGASFDRLCGQLPASDGLLVVPLREHEAQRLCRARIGGRRGAVAAHPSCAALAGVVADA
ncbi:hypothetical protein P4233_16165 [Pseudomonas aeruginosa]|nr:hypothetical protein [Pseudomonas aeruginosa]